MKMLLNNAYLNLKCEVSIPIKKRIVLSRIKQEHDKFHNHILRLEKEEIMNRCCKIRFYDCIKEYFQYNNSISDEVFVFLMPQTDIIHTLWELYLKYEQFDCSTWEQIDELLEHWINSSTVN